MYGIFSLTDTAILQRIGIHLRTVRLRQNITQESLAESSGVSLSSIKKIEKGEIRSFDSFIRLLRMLGELEVLLPLVEQEEISPNEYYKMVHSAARSQRKRASGKISNQSTEESEW